MANVRLTAAQALVRFLAAQMTEVDGRKLPIFAGVWAIFGHGNVAAIHQHVLCGQPADRRLCRRQSSRRHLTPPCA
jgi:TPP-dependent trihydroxycyclohexane-1,2-dione (THcHDO) dehydratase